MHRLNRREFTRTASGLAVLATKDNARATEPRFFALEFIRFSNSESAANFHTTKPGAVVLEAMIAPHVPELLVVYPTRQEKDALVRDAAWPPKQGTTHVYELRRYKQTWRGDGRDPWPSEEQLRRHGIQTILKGTVDGDLVYIIGFATLEARAAAWQSLTCDPPAFCAGESYQLGFYRRWNPRRRV